MAEVGVEIPIPDHVREIDLRVVAGSAIEDRTILLSCILNTKDRENVEIPKWPKYRRNDLPSKFLKGLGVGEVQHMPHLTLDEGTERRLQVVLGGRRLNSFDGWKVLMFAGRDHNRCPLIWVFDFGENFG